MSTQELETMPHASLQGWVPSVADESELRAALEQAFDYRGDVTITLKSGETVVGYVFDRRPGKSLADSFVRILPEDSPKNATSPMRRLLGWRLPDETARWARAGKRGSKNTTTRKQMEKPTSGGILTNTRRIRRR